MNVYQKLNEAREKFHTSPIKKSGLNKFAGYKYFELGDFVVPAIQIFKEVGLTSVIRFTTDHAFMEIVDNEKPEDKIVISSPMSTNRACKPFRPWRTCWAIPASGCAISTPGIYIVILF